MISDRLCTFANSDALTASGALTNVLDFGPSRNMGTGKPLHVMLQVLVGADAGNGDETYSFAVQTDSTDSFASPITIGTITVPRGTAAGAKFSHGLSNAAERYVRLYATLGGTSPSITVRAWLGDELPSNWSALADAI